MRHEYPVTHEPDPVLAPSGVFARVVRAVQRRPLPTLAIALLLTVASALFTARTLGVNTSTTDMIAPDVPFRQALVEYRAAFPDSGNRILAVVDARTGPAADRAAEALAERLRARPDRFETVSRPVSGPFFEQHGLLYQPEAELADLVGRLAAAQPFLATLAEDPTLRGFTDVVTLALENAGPDDDLAALADVLERTAAVVEAQTAGAPQVLDWQTLVTGGTDGAPLDTRRFVIIRPVEQEGAFSPAAASIDTLRATVAALEARPELAITDIRLTGSPVLEQEELASVSRGASVAGILSLALVSVILGFGLRSGRLILAVLVTLVTGLIWTAGFAALAIGSLNLISVAFAVLFVGLAVDFGIHFTLRVRELHTHSVAPRAAITKAAAGVGPALVLSALCAAIGFFAFVPTSYLGLAELGVISGTSMVIALLANFTVLPALMTLFPPRLRSQTVVEGRAGRVLQTLATRGAGTVLAMAGAAALAAAVLVPQVRFDVNPLNLQNPEAEAVRTYRDLADDPRTTPYTIDILAPDLETARDLADRLDTLEVVARTLTLGDFVPDDQDAKLALIEEMSFLLFPVFNRPAETPDLGADARAAAVDALRRALQAPPDQVTEAAGALADALTALQRQTDFAPEALRTLEARLTGTLPDLFDRLDAATRAGPVALEDLPESLRDDWIGVDGRTRVEVVPAIDVTEPGNLRRFATAVLAVEPKATGVPVVVTEAGAAVTQAFVTATTITLVAILVVLAVVLRRVGDVLLTVAPLGLAAVFTLGTMVVVGLPLNFANIIVLPLLFALGVSGAIHIVARHRESRAAGAAAPALLDTCTPRAVLLSALTTVASFGSLGVSEHRGTAGMGLLLTLAIALSLLCTLVVLPSLLHVLQRRRLRRAARTTEIP